MRLFMSEAEAVNAGMTHHGSLFGVPAWVRPTPEGMDAVPKCLPLQAWCTFADWAYDFAARLMPMGTWVEAPMSVSRPIAIEALP